jgi:hypothetical protein
VAANSAEFGELAFILSHPVSARTAALPSKTSCSERGRAPRDVELEQRPRAAVTVADRVTVYECEVLHMVWPALLATLPRRQTVFAAPRMSTALTRCSYNTWLEQLKVTCV